jgi:error-prone DNA polymerase
MRLVKGLRQDDADAIAEAIAQHGPFDSIEALRRASGVRIAALRTLAQADAFGSMGLDRQRALWAIRALRDERLPLFDGIEPEADDPDDDDRVQLPEVAPSKQVVHDYASMHLSLKAHPISFIRERLDRMGVTPAEQLTDEGRWPIGRWIAVAGLVLIRQRPSTASGIVFMTLEDETGIANLIVRPGIYKRFRRAARHGVAVLARGRVEREGKVVHVHVSRFQSLDDEVADLAARSRDFH